MSKVLKRTAMSSQLEAALRRDQVSQSSRNVCGERLVSSTADILPRRAEKEKKRRSRLGLARQITKKGPAVACWALVAGFSLLSGTYVGALGAGQRAYGRANDKCAASTFSMRLEDSARWALE